MRAQLLPANSAFAAFSNRSLAQLLMDRPSFLAACLNNWSWSWATRICSGSENVRDVRFLAILSSVLPFAGKSSTST